jgi:hypothetical protein
VTALLHAYFDESGTHNQYGRQVTLVSGFIGTSREWRRVNKAWTLAMNGETFHYTDYQLEGGLLARLADILAESRLCVVSAGFSGDWDKAISHKSGWKIRFPSCYHLVFEQCAEHMDRLSVDQWNNEPIATMFSRQNEYAKRSEEVWRTAKGNGLWQNLISFTYGDPGRFPQLQAADMIAHETFQCLKVGDDLVWQRWPLVRRFLAENAFVFGGYHSTETFIEMMKRSEEGGRKYLRTVPKT